MKTEQVIMNEQPTPQYYWDVDREEQQPCPKAQEKTNGLYNEQRNDDNQVNHL